MQNIVVSMTSYPKRIKTIHILIQNFLKYQTIKPDIFYLWLSILDFPNKENDLSKELINCINNNNIQLKWQLDNYYSFKRFFVYPQHNNDYCLFIDDDVYYSNTVIYDCLNVLHKYPNTICNIWQQYTAIPIYNGIKRIGFDINKLSNKNIKYWWCANCMIPPMLFPIQVFNYLNIYNKYCESNEQLFIIPFLIKNNIQISFNPIYTPFIEIQSNIYQQFSIHKNCNTIIGQFHKHDIILFNVLKNLNMFQIYKKIYNNYNYENYLNNTLLK